MIMINKKVARCMCVRGVTIKRTLCDAAIRVDLIQSLHRLHRLECRPSPCGIAIANQLLDRQLFDDEPLRHAVSMSTPGLTVNGADGVALHMARMIQDQQDVMVEAGMVGESR